MLKIKDKVRTLKEVNDNDWKTVLAQNIKSIPKNTILEIKDIWYNLYGEQIRVEYNNRKYDLNSYDLEKIEE